MAGEVYTVMQHATDFQVAISKWQKMTRLPSTRRSPTDSVPTVASLTVSLCSGYEPLRSLLMEKNFSQREGGRWRSLSVRHIAHRLLANPLLSGRRTTVDANVRLDVVSVQEWHAPRRIEQFDSREKEWVFRVDVISYTV